MSRILVIHPPASLSPDFIDYPWFSDLGAVQLAAVLRARGHEVALLDAHALPGADLRPTEDGRLHLGASVAALLEAAAALGPDALDAVVVATTPFHRPPRRDERIGALLEALRARHPEAALVLADCYQSGQHYVDADSGALLGAYPEADAFVKHEAEVTLPALLERAERPRGVHLGERAALETLPFPAWDLVDLAAHDAFRARVVGTLGGGRWTFPIDGRTLPLVTSRGCPFECVHCSSNPDRRPGEPKTQRRYPADRLRAYLTELVERHGATRLSVLDELANVSERHFDALIDVIDGLDVRFDVPNGLRADYLEARHLARMRGRVTTVSVSAESGSQRVVTEVVGKRLDLTHVHRAAESARRAGIPLMVHYMIGLPGETAEEINQTLDFALDLWDQHRALPALQFATPLPGTGLARGRALPVVTDWGPSFQRTPSQPDAAVGPEALRRFKQTFDRRLRASLGPEKLVVNLTYVCNNRCTFCAVGTRTQVDGHPVRQREHLAKYRRHGVKMVDFDGGEPTLHPELVSLVRYARRIGYEKVNVTTNGRMLAYEDYARSLVQSGVTTLLFSIHGADAKTHAQQVGVAEAFDQSVEGIRNAVRHLPSDVALGMNITLTKGNHEQLGEVAALAASLGLRWLNVQFLTPFGRATKWVAPDTRRAAQITMRVIDAWKDRMKIQVINLPFCFLPGYERHLVGDLGKLARHMIFVTNDGVNLAAYLAERRARKPECAPCPQRVFCGGFYELDDVPEPPWLVSPESLVRTVGRDLDVG